MGILVFGVFVFLFIPLSILILIFVPCVRFFVFKKNPARAYKVITSSVLLISLIAQVLFLHFIGDTFKCYMNTCTAKAYWNMFISGIPITIVFYIPALIVTAEGALSM